jgi:hypothetical protein
MAPAVMINRFFVKNKWRERRVAFDEQGRLDVVVTWTPCRDVVSLPGVHS